MQIGARLIDPTGAVPDSVKMAELQDKIASCMTRMFRKPENGGNPFLFSLSAPKPHEVRITLPGSIAPFTTAATDGKRYYWCPEFLAKLTKDEVGVVMDHESYHIILFHPSRMKSANPKIRNIAMDYVVNSIIEHEWKRQQFKGKLWGGNLGDPLPLKKLLEYIDGKVELPEDNCVFADITQYNRSPEEIYDEIMRHWEKSPRKCPQCGALSIDPKTGKPKKQKGKNQQPGQQCPAQQGQPQPGQGQQQGPQGQGQPGGQSGNGGNQPGGQGGHTHGPHGPGCTCPGQGACCPTCGTPYEGNDGNGVGDGLPMPMDAHIDAQVNKQEVQADVMRAAQQTTQMRGLVPQSVEEAIGELMKPTLKFTDLVRSSCMKKVQDAGLLNDWKRFRRRWIAATPSQYLPKRHSHKPRWLAMLDTSGSMSEDDLVYAISQLKALGNTEGYILPCDADPKWDAITKVERVEDLKRTKISGRGGTDFTMFLKEYAKHLGNEWDCIIILTDGYCGDYSKDLKPKGVDVVWVLTNYQPEWKQPFGRKAPLRVKHK